MKKELLEYIKVACFVVIAISLAIIAWKVSYLQTIEEELYNIGNMINYLRGE